MSGGGIGGTLGSLLGAALAPETGGLSLAIPAIAGAGGAYLGGALTGSKNPMMDALLGGIGGGLSGAAGLGDKLGIGNSAGFFGNAGDAISGGVGDAALSDGVSGADAPWDVVGESDFTGESPMDTGEMNPATGNYIPNGNPISPNNNQSTSDQLLKYLGKQNPLNLALAGGSVLSGVQSLLPKPKVNVGQNAANVMATNPSFNAALPQYNIQNSGTPYTGDWYKYGQTPETPMYSATLQPATMARGGMVKGYAAGGPAMPMPMGAPPMMPPQGIAASQPRPPMSPQMAGMPPQSAAPNPLALQAAHKVGLAIGQHLKSKMSTPPGQVKGDGGGQDDAIPAKLSQGEYIVPADVVGHLGDGSSNAGGKALDGMVKKVRVQKAVKTFPPKAKNPLAYMPKGKMK